MSKKCQNNFLPLPPGGIGAALFAWLWEVTNPNRSACPAFFGRFFDLNLGHRKYELANNPAMGPAQHGGLTRS